jgi:hypothetical protein
MQMAGLQGMASGLAAAPGAVQSDRAADDWGRGKSNQNWEWSAADDEAFNDPYLQ